MKTLILLSVLVMLPYQVPLDNYSSNEWNPKIIQGDSMYNEDGLIDIKKIDMKKIKILRSL